MTNNKLIKTVLKMSFNNITNNLSTEAFNMIKQCLSDKYTYNISMQECSDIFLYSKLCEAILAVFPEIKRNTYHYGFITDHKTNTTNCKLPIGKRIYYKHNTLMMLNVENTKDTTMLNLNLIGLNAKKYYNFIHKKLNSILRNDNKLRISFNITNYNNSKICEDLYDINNIYSDKKDEIINILENFKKSAKLYKDHQLSHKIGILLYGEPGTGKTSFAKAIASYMHYDLISLKANMICESTKEQLAGRSNLVILFEDIDCTVGVRKNSNNDNSNNNSAFTDLSTAYAYNTIGDMLGLLDGIGSPTNCIFVGTTNFKDNLDKALLRKSRFDYQIEIGNIDKHIAEDMCKGFGIELSDVYPDMKDDEKVNPSHLQFLILEYIKNRL